MILVGLHRTLLSIETTSEKYSMNRFCLVDRGRTGLSLGVGNCQKDILEKHFKCGSRGGVHPYPLDPLNLPVVITVAFIVSCDCTDCKESN